MSNWKISPPSDLANEEKIKERFGDKSKQTIFSCLRNLDSSLIKTLSPLSELVVLTGTSSGLGRKTAQALLRTGDYHVIGAVRDLDKMEAVAEVDDFDLKDFTPMECELNSFDSVRKFCDDVKEFTMNKPIDRFICNAGVYQPTLPYAKWSADGHEQTMQINYLSHFLMLR